MTGRISSRYTLSSASISCTSLRLGGSSVSTSLLRSAQNQPFSAQMIAQQRRIANQMIAISVAPRAREAFPIAKAVKIQNIDHIPDFRSLIIDRRAGKADDPFTFLG